MSAAVRVTTSVVDDRIVRNSCPRIVKHELGSRRVRRARSPAAWCGFSPSAVVGRPSIRWSRTRSSAARSEVMFEAPKRPRHRHSMVSTEPAITGQTAADSRPVRHATLELVVELDRERHQRLRQQRRERARFCHLDDARLIRKCGSAGCGGDPDPMSRNGVEDSSRPQAGSVIGWGAWPAATVAWIDRSWHLRS